MEKYYYAIKENWFGPFNIDEIVSLNLGQDTMIWYPELCKNGMDEPSKCNHDKVILSRLLDERKKTNFKQIGVKKEGYFCIIIQLESTNADTLLYAKKRLKKRFRGNDEYKSRLKREISILQKLQDCPNIIELICSEQDQQDVWYIMPYADHNLYDYIKKNNQSLKLEDRIDIFKQVISAIKFAHDRDIIHRDISPSNILLFNTQDKPIVKISDFGLGKMPEQLSHLTNSSAHGYGQILYVSPEQREKLKEGDKKSDIYALGKLSYFVFTGKDPDNIRLFDFSTLYRKATEEEPAQRYENIEEFEVDFERICDVLTQLEKIPLEHLTVRELYSSGEWDWFKLHYVAVNGIYNNHVYSDYIEPITLIFSKKEKIQEYLEIIGNGVIDFLTTFAIRLDECFGRLNWPFDEAKRFGNLLLAFYQNIESDEGKLICINQLWDLGYIRDRWAAQKDFKTALETLPSSLYSKLSEHIISNNFGVELSSFDDIVLPSLIKAALIAGNEKAKDHSETEENFF